MTARRSLTPAARGVSLAVLAALRAGRVDLADQADGSTLATSTAPDGTELLRATLRMPVRGADPRQLTLGAVSLTPQPAEVPPAPVAVPAGDAPRSLWIAMDEWHGTDPQDREWLHEPVEGVMVDWTGSAPPLWMTADAPSAPALASLRRYCGQIGVTLFESDTMPPPPARGLVRQESKAAPERGAFALAPGDLITLDGARVRVAHVDGEGFTWAEVDRNGFSVGEVERCLWREVEHLGDNRWRILPVETETPAAKAKREKAAKPKRAKAAKVAPAPVVPELPQGDEAPEVRLWIREAEWDALDENTRTEFEEPIGGSGVDWQGREGWVTALVPADEILTALRGMAAAVAITLHEGDAAPAAKRAKAPPARNVPVPEADNLAVYGQRSIVAIIHEGGPWELVWSDEMPGHMTYDVAVSATTAQAHRVRVYHRGKRCTRDSRDGAK